MKNREWMAMKCREVAADNSHGYTNDYPDNQWWNEPDLDCGSLMSYILHLALLNCGIDTGHRYFEPMGGWYPWNRDFLLTYCDEYSYEDVYNEVGDILVSAGHTEMYTAKGELTGARNDYDGRTGDWTYGTEIATGSFYDASGGWRWIYRLKDEYNIEVGSDPESEGLDMAKIPTVEKGDTSNVVLSYQYLMKYKLGYDKMTCDGYFGDQMHFNVRHYQAEHGLYVDGVIGEETGYDMIVRSGYEEP